ncbi:MAG: ribbon-helix-helix protein, CopG family [Dehalococcoidia bacterium]
MKRLIFSLPDELFLAIQRLAQQEGKPMAAILRDAAEEKVCRARPRPRSFGMGASGRSDISRRIGDEQFVPDPFR